MTLIDEASRAHVDHQSHTAERGDQSRPPVGHERQGHPDGRQPPEHDADVDRHLPHDPGTDQQADIGTQPVLRRTRGGHPPSEQVVEQAETVQGNRVAFDEGESVPIYMGAIGAFTDYDLEAGVRADPDRGLGTAVVDTMQGMSRRFGGVTSIIVVYERVPGDVEFLGGKSIWQPAASSVPVLPSYVDLDFKALSLGRYFTTTFIADDQEDNASSQAITMVGDLYINFGNVGVVIGMIAWGLAIGRLDKLVGPSTATRVGALVYLGHILIGLERNVAYLLVNGAIRVMVLLLVLRAVARWGRRETNSARLLRAESA